MAKATKNPLDIFDLADPAYRHRIIGLSMGEVGGGKTHFWLQAPAPIVIFSLDQGLEGVVEQFVEQGKEIRVREYEWMPTEETSQEEAVELRDKFTAEYELAIQHARTVILDKETHVWELFRYAEFGAPNDAPRNYPALNQRYRRLINLAKATDVNLGLIQSMKDEWTTKTKADGGQKGFKTGDRVAQGFSELDGLVHVVLTHRREQGKFFIDISKSRGPGGQDVWDQTFEGYSFSDLAQLIFPSTNEADWQ